jgi:heavy metal efflux system protein
MRFNELLGGVRSDVAVKLYGDDVDQLALTARQITNVLRNTPGAVDTRFAQTTGFPTFDIVFDRAAIGRYGLSVKEVAETVSAALAGLPSGQVFEGDRRFDVVIRLPGALRNNLDILGALPVKLPAARSGEDDTVLLRQLVQFRFNEGLNEVSRDNGKRRIYIETNIEGRDLGSFVDEAKKRIEKKVVLPSGSWIEWGGQFQNLQEATNRLMIVIPVCLLLIIITIYLAVGSVPLAAIIMTAVPLSTAGGVFALVLRDMPLSISAAVGFIAVSGVAVLNGLVLIGAIQKRVQAGIAADLAVIDGTIERLRPVLMTALVASLGFIPMAIATGTGAEVQKPLATVVIGGLVTATILTLLVLPMLAAAYFKRGRSGEQVVATLN